MRHGSPHPTPSLATEGGLTRYGQIARIVWLIGIIVLITSIAPVSPAATVPRPRPNILLAIADDQSYPHASAYGARGVHTPGFDRVAKAGVLFNNCMAASPGCSPSRAALLTGRHHWQLQQAGTHASSFPHDYVTFPDLLEANGYFVGHTGKGWGPGNFKISGRTRNPAGPSFTGKNLKTPASGISKNDYADNFATFLEKRPQDQPFCFWYGAFEPHRGYEKGSGQRLGKKLEDVDVPSFLPDTPEIRADLLDYMVEIEWFDTHLARMLDLLNKAGQLDNTLVIVTADNGMPFPRAKANLYEYGIHVPLAVAWPDRVSSGRLVHDPVGFVDLTATILEAAGVRHPAEDNPSLAPVGRSLMALLQSNRSTLDDPSPRPAFSGRERHSSSRHDNLGYPCRALRTERFLYIRNFAPERWPAGDPQKFVKPGQLGPMHGGYHDIDACPTFDFLIKHRDNAAIQRFFNLSVAKRPREELFDIQTDPDCLHNLVENPEFLEILGQLRDSMESELRRTHDPRVGLNPSIWETYPRYSPIRSFPPSP